MSEERYKREPIKCTDEQWDNIFGGKSEEVFNDAMEEINKNKSADSDTESESAKRAKQ